MKVNFAQLMSRRLCYVLLPFGKKSLKDDLIIDFDIVYQDLVAPAIYEAGLDAFRIDKQQIELTDRASFESFILCQYAIVDLTIANTDTFYYLGMRNMIWSGKTVLL